MGRHRWVIVIVTAALLQACASGPDRRPDSGPDRPVDVSRVPEPTPRDEPLSRYGNPETYVVHGQRYHVMDSATGYVERGTASWYGTKFHGQRTSSGETYDMYAMTAAHRSLPLPTYVEVTNLDNDRSIVVRVNDRGPFVAGRIIDLSYAAAVRLGMADQGTAPVEVRAISPGRDGRRQVRDDSAGDEGDTYYLQVGAFRERGNAERLERELRRHAVSGVEIREGTGRASGLFQVRVGPLNGMRQVNRVYRELGDIGIPRVHVVAD